MLFRPALLEGEAEERLSAGFGCRQPAAAPLSAAGPVPESGASSQKRQAAGRQNAAFGQILGLSRRGALSHRLRDRPAVRAARKNRSARQPERCADRPKTPPRAGASHFYPRSPRGERQYREGKPPPIQTISIHAPREGSDDKIQQTSKMDFAQKSQMKILNTLERVLKPGSCVQSANMVNS